MKINANIVRQYQRDIYKITSRAAEHNRTLIVRRAAHQSTREAKPTVTNMKLMLKFFETQNLLLNVSLQIFII